MPFEPGLRSDTQFAPLIEEICSATDSPPSGAQIAVTSAPDAFWVIVCRETGRRPEQGWKIHISAGVQDAIHVLHKALPVLIRECVDFKVVASLARLSMLNDGLAGLSQVGKFVTVFPDNDRQAVSLACALDEMTRGLRGPCVPSDRPLHVNSLVHYRYGGFDSLHLCTRLGEILPAVRTPSGTLVEDHRSEAYAAPEWASDPFVAAGVAHDLQPKSAMLGQRYVIAATLHRSPRSIVRLCLDVTRAKSCVVKRVDDDGSGSVERLRREAEILAQFASDTRIPDAIQLFEDERGLCLAMEDIEGQTIESLLIRLRERNELPTVAEVVQWGISLADILHCIHAKAFVYSDLKSSNVMITPDGEIRLIDFDVASAVNDDIVSDALPFAAGTRGYASPQQSAGHPPTIADDIYSLGALLYLLATGAEPSRAPDYANLLARPLQTLNPTLPQGVAEVIERCLQPQTRQRFASASQVASALLSTAGNSDHHGRSARPIALAPHRTQALNFARDIGDLLCERWARGSTSTTLDWARDSQFGAPGTRDLGSGAAGAVLGLAELVAQFDDPAHREVLSRSAKQLSDNANRAHEPLPGLYVGEAGVGAAQLRAGQVLGDSDLIYAATRVGRQIAAAAHCSPDLFNGTAGRLRFHLLLWQETDQEEHLHHAVVAGEYLLRLANAHEGIVSWTMPEGFDRLSGLKLTGYAHGAAGIADALLDLYLVTADSRLLETAVGVGCWLDDTATPLLNDGHGTNWPSDVNTRPRMAFWCHGAAGIARFLLRLGSISGDSSAIDLARSAAVVVANGTRWSGPTQCHGLAGNIECLLDVYQATGEMSYLEEAEQLASLLPAFAPSPQGRLTVVTAPETSNLGFSIGCAGIAASLLRLADPHMRPHLLTMDGFHRRFLSRRL